MTVSDLVGELRVILEERANGGDKSKVKRCHPGRFAKKREKKNPSQHNQLGKCTASGRDDSRYGGFQVTLHQS